MNDDVSHLTAGAAALLIETDERRIRAIRSRRWVLYPRAKQALDRLSSLLDHPRGTRMPSVAIYGDSGMGKTMIMKRFRDEHSPRGRGASCRRARSGCTRRGRFRGRASGTRPGSSIA